jgi:glycosyltransferase involved in cell wall biosynthesis
VFRDNPPTQRERRPSLCLVAHDFADALGDDGSRLRQSLIAHLLADRGWYVHVLYCGEVRRRRDLDAVRARLAQRGIDWSLLEDWTAPEVTTVPGRGDTIHVQLSERVRHVLQKLHQQHRFDLAEFGERGALGFRAIQARCAGIAFADLPMLVKLRGSTQWIRERNHVWPADSTELELDYCERSAFENADVQLSHSVCMFEYARGIGWEVKSDARVIPDLCPVAQNALPVFSTGAQTAAVHERPRRDFDAADSRRAVVEAYEDLVRRLDRAAWPHLVPSEERDPLVTVAVTFYNLGQYLPETLGSLAAQSYRNLEVLVIDDGSTDLYSKEVLARQERLYPQFRFQRQENLGIGAARNRGLWDARGEFFIPMDADNIAEPRMVETFASALRLNPELSAMSCYYLAFRDAADLRERNYLYAYRPTGGPHVLASLKNVYGDANAVFRTEALRSVGGYETDRDTSWEDWEAFVKLVHAGHKLGTVPEHLFYYRHLETGFSRVTDLYLNQRRVLRQYFRYGGLPQAEGIALWTALISLEQRNNALAMRLNSLPNRLAHHVHAMFARVPTAKKGVRWLLRSSGQVMKYVKSWVM